MAIEWPWVSREMLNWWIAQHRQKSQDLLESLKTSDSLTSEVRKLLLENASLQKQILTLQQEKQQNQEQKVIRAKSPADVRRMAEHAFALDEVVE